jgi:hypothetical protein
MAANEQIFGGNQQVPHVGRSDKEAKVAADVSLPAAIAVMDRMANGERLKGGLMGWPRQQPP